MAKNNKSKGSGAYIFAGILIAIIYIINTFLVESIYWGNQEVSQKTGQANSALNKINSELTAINMDSISIAAGIIPPEDIGITMGDTNKRYGNIIAAEHQFEAIEDLSPTVVKRYNYAKSLITAFKDKLDSLGTKNVKEGNEEMMSDILKQEIYPLQTTASEMLISTIDVVNVETAKMNAANTKRAFALMTVMMIVAILGEIAVWLFARRAKKIRAELEEREKNLAEVDAKLKATRQKASDLAVINVLTGMKNRYALDSDVSDRLETGRFNIAVFDMDNFRSINDTYGYDFGDEYLAAVAEKLKEEFGDVAEIYNITGNEFCFLFNSSVTESQAMGIAQNIQRVMSSPYEVLNLAVQLPCSGAVYHYLPGDCLNVNSLLVKLDTALRTVKMNGGNMINTVMNM
ncbi:GGDEF domain-containing protein [Ruminococcus flavefaciens]|uniref:Diguanylate cyclase (GGDEF)-like protein n=1 Tax=Ruminococcus flavefaciens TaxID=1265 RepID=A0A315XTF9_RUMFL|nr:GGDEF domain-containing protein [Ruminococcus flavefaciens]PWJ09813.1 diguanylate cyclase (GGDEF)-like protein [Ruminococcus flavefaciens]SSA52215.1 diguanylate cyclase (GGDEF) domain-containing protein [Ruminococcus flavefaciens]